MIDFPQLLNPSYTPFSSKVDCERSINVFREKLGVNDEGGNQFALYKSPGLNPYITSLQVAPVRQMLAHDPSSTPHVFAIVGDTIYDLIAGGTSTTYSPIPNGNDVPTMAASSTSLLVVTGGLLLRANGGTLSLIALSFTPISVRFLKNYFVVLSDTLQQFYWSDDDGATFPADQVQTFESDSNAVLTMDVLNQQLFLIGTKVGQVYYVGSNPDAPFVANDGAYIQSGTRAPASLRKLGESLIWMESSTDGQFRVILLNGYTPIRISNAFIENKIREFAKLGTVDDAIGMSFQLNGQEFYRLTFPTADYTLEFNKTLMEWEETVAWDWQSNQYRRHRGNCCAAAFGKILMGDHTNGIIYELDPNTYHDYGYPLRWNRRTPHLLDKGNGVVIERLELGIETGVGLTQPLLLNNYSLDAATFVANLATAVSGATVTAGQSVVLTNIYNAVAYDMSVTLPDIDVTGPLGFYEWGRNPTITMKYSNDGGKSDSNELSRSIGASGEDVSVSWDRLGSGRDRVIELFGDDPCKLAITGAWIDAEGLKS